MVAGRWRKATNKRVCKTKGITHNKLIIGGLRRLQVFTHLYGWLGSVDVGVGLLEECPVCLLYN